MTTERDRNPLRDAWSNLVRDETYWPGTRRLHSYDDEPALTEYHFAKTKSGEEPRRDGVWKKAWYQNGVPSRANDKPTMEVYDPDGNLVEEHWQNHQHNLHREGGPALKRWENGERLEMWYTNGVLDRDGAPAITGDKGTEMWMKNNLISREDGGPAVTFTRIINDEPVVEQQWRVEGDAHRLDGPAIVRSNGDEEYWVGGLLVNDLQFMALCEKLGDEPHPLNQYLKAKKVAFEIDRNLTTLNRGVNF